MKKSIIFIMFLCTLISCSYEDRTERTFKRDIKNFLKEHLNDPASLRDLEISYVTLSLEQKNDAFSIACKSGDENATLKGATFYDAVVAVTYRAKNPFGAYTKEFDILLASPPNLLMGYPSSIKFLEEEHSFLVDYVFDSDLEWHYID